MNKTLSVGYQKPTVRLSKQAKEFLLFLEVNNINGSVYQEQESKKIVSIDQMIADRQNVEHHYPVIAPRMKGDYIRKGISIINYIDVTGKSTVRFYEYGCGGYAVEKRSVLISLERTVKNLRLKGLVDRFKHDRMFHYFIMLKGKQILKCKDVT